MTKQDYSKNIEMMTNSELLREQESDELTPTEQASLNKGIEQAHLIKAGKLKALSFDDLWRHEAGKRIIKPGVNFS